MSKKLHITLILVMFLISGCSAIERKFEPTIIARVEGTISSFTKVPTNTPFATHTAYPTLTSLPTYTPEIIVVTATFTKTPKYTATITLTPTDTSTPTPTEDPTKTKKSPGFYLVGDEISPGVWRSLGTSDSCYWSITDRTGDIINNHFGMAGGTMYIPTSAFQVELDADCGSWEFIGN
jgi:hypothetical protein